MILNIYIFFADRNFDYALGQFSPDGPGFPSIISAGNNNFCIHYYGYTGQAKDGDMILNDVSIYHEEWGIRFRLEDNCLVTEDGCENLSAGIPRTIQDIEAAMRGE